MTIWERAVEAQWKRGEDQRATVCLHADKQLYSGMFDVMMEKFREVSLSLCGAEKADDWLLNAAWWENLQDFM